MNDQPNNSWLELAKRVTDAERTYTRLADDAWQDGGVTRAIRFRGVAEGLALARGFQLEVSAEARDGAS